MTERGDARVVAIADSLASNDRAAVKALFAEHGWPQPVFVWDPPAESLPPRQLAFLRRHWDAMRAGAEVPEAAALRIEELGEAAGHFILVDLERDGLDFRYARYAEAVAKAGGNDWTGLTGAEVEARTGSPLPTFYRGCNLAVRARRRALFSLHSGPAGGRLMTWARLGLPLVDRHGGQVVRVLIGSVPMEQAPLTYADVFALGAGYRADPGAPGA
jgi:hypothetical protein